MRLVDADELKKVDLFNGIWDKKNGNRHFMYGIETVVEYINSLPTIDPVKRGEWVAQDAGHTRFMCSACGSKNYWGYEKYCPNCGAKMRDEK